MEGRYPPGIRMIFTKCRNPAREEEFNDWYDRIHLPDMVASGLVSSPTRYKIASLEPGEPTYLAIYELERDDIENIPQEIARVVEVLRERGRTHPTVELVRAQMWRRIEPRFHTDKTGQARVTGIVSLQADFSDPRREQEFNAYCDQMNLLDILPTGLVHTAYRFQAVLTLPEQSKYLILFETDADDPSQAAREICEVHWPRWIREGHLSDTAEVTWRGVFIRLHCT